MTDTELVASILAERAPLSLDDPRRPGITRLATERFAWFEGSPPVVGPADPPDDEVRAAFMVLREVPEAEAHRPRVLTFCSDEGTPCDVFLTLTVRDNFGAYWGTSTAL